MLFLIHSAETTCLSACNVNIMFTRFIFCWCNFSNVCVWKVTNLGIFIIASHSLSPNLINGYTDNIQKGFRRGTKEGCPDHMTSSQSIRLLVTLVRLLAPPPPPQDPFVASSDLRTPPSHQGWCPRGVLRLRMLEGVSWRGAEQDTEANVSYLRCAISPWLPVVVIYSKISFYLHASLRYSVCCPKSKNNNNKFKKYLTSS